MKEINLLPDNMKLEKNKTAKNKFYMLMFMISFTVIFSAFFIPKLIIVQMEDNLHYLSSQIETNKQFGNLVIDSSDNIKIKNYVNEVDKIKNDKIVLSNTVEDLYSLISEEIQILDLQYNGKSMVLNCKTNNFNSIIGCINLMQESLEMHSINLENISFSQGQNSFLFRIKIDSKRGSKVG
jgi:Tfp pilus assembly protein PilN